MRNRDKKEKYCLNCGLPIPNRNKYCNNKCQGDFERKVIFEKIENGDLSFTEHLYKEFLINKFGNKCMECGWCEIHPITNNVPIQLEHEDGNSDNNELYNLKLLCPNCHSLTPTFGALNKGNGRKKRQEKRLKEKGLK